LIEEKKMKRVPAFAAAGWVILVAPLFLGIVFQGAVSGQTSGSTYTLGLSGPDVLAGTANDTASGHYLATLTQEGGGTGAQGWSISVAVDGALIDSLTTAGTDVDALFAGGFNKTEVVDPAKNAGQNGAVSAVVLSFTQARTLPSSGTSTIADLLVKGTIPDPAGLAALRYQDGLNGSGQPVKNAITQEGNTIKPVLDSKEIQLVPIPTCCGAKLNLGFSGSKVSSASAYNGIVEAPQDPPRCTADGGAIVTQVPEGQVGKAHVFVNISSNGADTGVQGWSFSIASNGDLEFQSPVSVTTTGTSVDSFFQGGFNKTEPIDPGKNSGQRGVVSAVVLSFTVPKVLPATGTESVLDLGVQANAPQAGADIAGSLSFLDSLRGSGQPVKNAITVGGETRNACNKELANVNVVFRLIGVSNYVRGNPNGDDKVNLADGVWIINELFRGGPSTSCPAAADMNADGTEDAADALYLVLYLFRGGPQPPAPFPACGGASDLNDVRLCPGGAVEACP
jgi:hypothetical protein